MIAQLLFTTAGGPPAVYTKILRRSKSADTIKSPGRAMARWKLPLAMSFIYESVLVVTKSPLRILRPPRSRYMPVFRRSSGLGLNPAMTSANSPIVLIGVLMSFSCLTINLTCRYGVQQNIGQVERFVRQTHHYCSSRKGPWIPTHLC